LRGRETSTNGCGNGHATERPATDHKLMIIPQGIAVKRPTSGQMQVGLTSPHVV
jgi:hypothetical protein